MQLHHLPLSLSLSLSLPMPDSSYESGLVERKKVDGVNYHVIPVDLAPRTPTLEPEPEPEKKKNEPRLWVPFFSLFSSFLRLPRRPVATSGRCASSVLL